MCVRERQSCECVYVSMHIDLQVNLYTSCPSLVHFLEGLTPLTILLAAVSKRWQQEQLGGSCCLRNICSVAPCWTGQVPPAVGALDMLLLIVSDRKSTVTQTGREAAAAAGTPSPAGRLRSSSLDHGELQPLLEAELDGAAVLGVQPLEDSEHHLQPHQTPHEVVKVDGHVGVRVAGHQ